MSFESNYITGTCQGIIIIIIIIGMFDLDSVAAALVSPTCQPMWDKTTGFFNLSCEEELAHHGRDNLEQHAIDGRLLSYIRV